MEKDKTPKYYDGFFREFMWRVFKEINFYMKAEYVYRSDETAFFIAGLLKANQECFQNYDRIYQFLSENDFIVAQGKIGDKKDQVLIVDPKRPFFLANHAHLQSFVQTRSTLTDEEQALIRDITIYFLGAMGEHEKVLRNALNRELERFTDDIRCRFKEIHGSDKASYAISPDKKSPLEISKEFMQQHNLIPKETLFVKIFKNSKDGDLALEF